MKRDLFLLIPVAAVAAVIFPSCAGGPGAAAPASGAAYEKSADAGGAARRSRIVPEDRPGLATGWGDEKTSHIEDVGFVRASSKPAGTDAIFYNDKDGIKAMSSYPASAKPMQQAAGGLVEWGVKGGSSFLPAYKEWGYGRRLVAGEKNGSYAIVVKNRCKAPLEIVASVDGLDVMDGKTASFAKRGYIVGGIL